VHRESWPAALRHVNVVHPVVSPAAAGSAAIMNQLAAGAADPGVSMHMLQDLLKELWMRAGAWQCEKLGARTAALGPRGRQAAGLLPGDPRNEREPR